MNNKERLYLDSARPSGAIAAGIKRPRCRHDNIDSRPTEDPSPGGAERNRMNRLPGCDRTTLASEWAVFVGLGLVGLALIGASFASSVQFSLQREAIMAAVSNDASGAMAAHAQRLKTNVVFIGAHPSPNQAPHSRPTATCPAVQSM